MEKSYKNLYWLWGSHYGRKNQFDKICSSIGDHDLFVYDESDDAYFVEQQILTRGIFSDIRLVVLYGLPHFVTSPAKNTRLYKGIFSKIPDDCVLVINGINPSKPSMNKTLSSFVKKEGSLLGFKEYLSEEEAIVWISKWFKSKKKDAQDDSIKHLIDLTGIEYKKGVNLDALAMHMEKIFAFMGSSRKVTKSIVRQLVDPGPETALWNICEALDARDLSLFESIVYRMLSNTNKIKEVAERLIFMLIWRYKLLVFIKESEYLGKSDSQIKNNLSELKRTKSSGFGQHTICVKDTSCVFSDSMVSFVLSKRFNNSRSVDKYSRRALFDIIESLDRNLLAIRTISSRITVFRMLDDIGLKVCCTIKT